MNSQEGITLAGLAERLVQFLDRHADDKVVVAFSNYGSVGGRPCIPVTDIAFGFDWDQGKVFLGLARQVVPCTPSGWNPMEMHANHAKSKSLEWHLDSLAAAFRASTKLDPSKTQIVRQQDVDGTLRIWFEERAGASVVSGASLDISKATEYDMGPDPWIYKMRGWNLYGPEAMTHDRMFIRRLLIRRDPESLAVSERWVVELDCYEIPMRLGRRNPQGDAPGGMLYFHGSDGDGCQSWEETTFESAQEALVLLDEYLRQDGNPYDWLEGQVAQSPLAQHSVDRP